MHVQANGMERKTYLRNFCIIFQTVSVLRGTKTEIQPRELVIGDIIELKAGDPVPADIRIIAVNKCKVSFIY